GFVAGHHSQDKAVDCHKLAAPRRGQLGTLHRKSDSGIWAHLALAATLSPSGPHRVFFLQYRQAPKKFPLYPPKAAYLNRLWLHFRFIQSSVNQVCGCPLFPRKRTSESRIALRSSSAHNSSRNLKVFVARRCLGLWILPAFRGFPSKASLLATEAL